MSTTIEKLIPQISSEDKIFKLINALPVENCINVYCEYKTTCSEDTFESKFINNLNNNTKEFAKLIIKKKYNNFSKEELIEIIQELYIHGVYTLDAGIDNDEEYLFYQEWFNDADLHELIKQELLNTFYETKKQLNTTKKEEEISLLKQNIAIIKSRIEKESEKLEDNEKKLEKLIEGDELR